MASFTVGQGKDFTTIADAVRATRDGDTVLVDAGEYKDDFFTVKSAITIKAVGGRANLIAVSSPPNGKAIVTADASLTIEGFGFTGAIVPDGNGAGIRYEAGDLVIRDSVFWNNQDGLLANAVSDGTITIENSEFSHNGIGDGYTHNLYVGVIASLTVRNSYFHDVVTGHEIKSRALSTTLIGNRIQDGPTSDASYSIDLPDGGVGIITGNVIEKGVNAQNYTAIHYGGEGAPRAGASLTITGNTIINDNAHGVLLGNVNNAGPATLSGNTLWGWADDRVVNGVATVGTNTILTDRPAVNMTSKVPTISVVTTPTVPTNDPVTVPTTAALRDWGSDGAVVASGRVLTVGKDGQFQLLGTALQYAQDGDTIKVQAGTYYDDYASVTKKVIIEGVGGMAKFVSTALTAVAGFIVVSADATLRNLDISGLSNPYNGHAAAITVTSGHVTIQNSYLHGNDVGLLADGGMNTAIVVQNTEIGPNGNGDKGTSNVIINPVESFVLRGSTVHGATTGHEITSFAYNSLVEDNRIYDGANVGASFLLNLGGGGDATIRRNVFEKGPDAANGVLIHVGGEQPAYINSDVRITDNVLITTLVNQWHPYTYFLMADPAAGDPPKIEASNNSFQGGVPGSAAYINLANSPERSLLTTTLDTTAPWSAAKAPASFVPVVKGPDLLTLTLSEDRGDADAHFVVTVDGVFAGTAIVTATTASGARQAVMFNGSWGEGPHVVAVSLIATQGSVAYGLTIHSIALAGTATEPEVTLRRDSTSWSTSLSSFAKLPGFDAAYYLSRYPNVAASGVDPQQDFLATGWKIGRNPNALFDTNYYLTQHPDVAASGQNPYLAYLGSGWPQGANPNAWFDARWYLDRHPDVAASGQDPLQHYLTIGWTEGFDPSPRFSVLGYLAANPDVARANVDPLSHYLNHGIMEGRALTVASDPLIDVAYYVGLHPDAAANPSAYFHTIGWQRGDNPSALFDTSYYLSHNRDVALSGIDPLTHYETVGWREGRDPSANFSGAGYLAANPDVRAAGVNPLEHFMQFGQYEHRPIVSAYAYRDPVVDSSWYLANHPDAAATGLGASLHYHLAGWKFGYDPNPLFDTSWYLQQHPNVAQAGIDPLAYYEMKGWTAGDDPSAGFSTSGFYAAHPGAKDTGLNPLQLLAMRSADPLVDPLYYYSQHPSLAATGNDPATHYHSLGWTLGYNPSPWFDAAYYLGKNPDVAAAHVDPLQHFESYGWREGRDPSPYFSLKSYEAAHPETSGTNPLISFVSGTEDPAQAGLNRYAPAEASLFDATYYLAHTPGVAASGLDPLTHFETVGWKAGYDPSATFSTTKYLAAYTDVRNAGVDPLGHYATYGVNEGRTAFAA